MKTILIKLFLTLLVLFFTVSCSKDDDGEGNNVSSSQLTGKWIHTYSGELNGEGEEVLEEYYNQPNCEEKDYLLFRSEGTGEGVTHYSCNPQIDEFDWTLSNSVLTLSDGWMTHEYEVLTLTNTTLKIYFEYEIEFNGETTVETYISVLEKE